MGSQKVRHKKSHLECRLLADLIHLHIAIWSLLLVIVTQSCLTLAAPWTASCQAPLSMEFSRQEYWNGLPFPSPGDRSDQGWNQGLPYCRWILHSLSHQESLTTVLFHFMTWYNYHVFFVLRTFKIYALKNFHMYNTVVFTIITMLYIRTPELIHLLTGSWSLYINLVSWNLALVSFLFKPNCLEFSYIDNPIISE